MHEQSSTAEQTVSHWPDGVVCCPRCGSERVTYLETAHVWKCYEKHAKSKFSIFEDSATNARLIAAAPDLLVTLRDLCEAAQSDSDTCCYCQRDVARHASGCLVTAGFVALAKAEGRS